MRNALFVSGIVLVVGATSYLGFSPARAGTPAFFALVCGPTVALAALGAARASRDGELAGWLRPRWGDFTRAFFVAAVLFGGAYLAARVVAPSGTPRDAWLARIYLQMGSPEDLRAHAQLVALAILILAAAEELLWRGLVTTLLAEEIGSRYAWVASAALYAVAWAPTMFALADPVAGPDPLLPMAALGSGLVLGAVARREGTLVPSLVAHALVGWCVVMMFRLWGASV